MKIKIYFFQCEIHKKCPLASKTSKILIKLKIEVFKSLKKIISLKQIKKIKFKLHIKFANQKASKAVNCEG